MRSRKEVQRKRVQKETNRDKQVCVCQSLDSTLEEDCCRENQHTPTHPCKHLSHAHTHTHKRSNRWPGCSVLHRQTHTLFSESKNYARSNLCVCLPACVHTRMRQCQCQGVGHCCLGPRQAPVRPPSAHEETDRRHSGDVGWMERERKKKERERKEWGERKGRLKEKD